MEDENMDFNEEVMAAVSLVLLDLLLYSVLMVAFVPLNSDSRSDMFAYTIAFLVGPLIVGFAFAPKIRKGSRFGAIGRILILYSFALMLSITSWYSTPFSTLWNKDILNRMFNTSRWTDYDLFAYSSLLVTLDVTFALLFNFIGLYVGLALRKSATTDANPNANMITTNKS